MVKASAMYAEGRGFDSQAGIFPDFCSIGRGNCRAGVDLCCLSLTVVLWIGILFLLSNNNIQYVTMYRALDPQCVYILNRMYNPFPTQ